MFVLRSSSLLRRNLASIANPYDSNAVPFAEVVADATREILN